ncbi:MAG TPA: hypothetical protein VGQ83_34750 [Polyangia bacterium]|jgi:hypothetical protein
MHDHSAEIAALAPPEDPVAELPMSILTSDCPSLVAALRLRFQRWTTTQVRVASTARDLVEAAAEHRPAVVILAVPDRDAAAEHGVISALRRTLARRARIFLGVPRARIGLLHRISAVDGLVAVDDPEHDLAYLIDRGATEPPAGPTAIPALLVDGAASTRALCTRLGPTAAQLLVASAPALHANREVVLYRSDGRRATVQAKVTSADVVEGECGRATLRFTAASVEGLRLIRDLALWQLEQAAPVVHLHGPLCDATDFRCLLRALARQDSATVTLDFAGVTGIDARGLVRWAQLLHEMPPGLSLRLQRLPPAVAGRVAQVPAMARRCVVASLRLP